MNHVTLEIWLWLGKELKGDFQSPTEMRSIREECVEEESTIGQLLDHLAKRYPPIARHIFDAQVKKLSPNIVVIYNDQVISPYVVRGQVLEDGDKVRVLPMYMGG